jgi:protein-disulfide isomerase
VSSRTRDNQASRMVREQLARERRRRRRLIVSIVAAVALVAAGLIGWGVYENQKPSNYATPAHATSDGNGIVVSTGKVQVDAYVDFICPICKQFETSAGPTIDQLIAARKINMIYHPIAILDPNSNPAGYSSRAGASSACAADGGKFFEYLKALYAQQPPEGSAGLSDDQLIQVGGSVGLINPIFAQCVRSGRYKSWIAHTTDASASKGVNGTPTVLVAGKQLALPTGDALTSAVNAAIK